MYPISYEADIPLEGRNRLTAFLRGLWAIPVQIVAFFYGLGAFFAVIVAWFSIVFTGKYPQAMYDFIGKALRVASRATSYYWLATDEYPAFNGDDDPSYPVRIGLPAPLDSYDRLKTGLRIIFGIPVYLLAIVWSVILNVVGIIAWFVILFTGKLPEGLAGPMRNALAYSTRAGGYFLLMTEDWPPFSDEGAGASSAGQIGSGTKEQV